MKVDEILELFRTEGFIPSPNGYLVRDGLEMNVTELNADAVAVRFRYPLADAQGTFHVLIDSLEWRDPLLKAIAAAEQVKKTAIEFYAVTHRYTGC